VAGSPLPLPNPEHRATQVLSAIIASAVDAIVVIDARGLMETFNPAAERLFGYRESEVIGRNVAMLMPPPFRDEHDGYLARYLDTGEAKIIGMGRDVQGLRRDGTVFPLHLSVGEMSIDGERKFTGILHDLTARAALEAQLRASEERWRSVIESAVDGIVVIDARGRVEAFNPAAERLFGYRESEVVGRNVNVLMPSPYHEEHDGYLARYLTTGHAKIIGIGREVTGRHADGSTFPLHLSVGEMQIDGEPHFTGILHDLSSRADLEDRLREATAMARLGEMAAVIAHEVKNPLAAVRGAIQVIGSRMKGDSGDGAIIREIIARIDALNTLIQDLLVFARPPQPKPVDIQLRELLTAVAGLLKADPAFSALEVTIAGDTPVLRLDPSLMTIVFQNLLMNSAQAMHGKGNITVALGTQDGWCRIDVIDHGPGIPAEIQAALFRPFKTTKARGTGLGMATAKRLVELHEGRISVTCPPGGGTMVTVELPSPA
jgi:two-component system sensor kinase FixL